MHELLVRLWRGHTLFLARVRDDRIHLRCFDLEQLAGQDCQEET